LLRRLTAARATQNPVELAPFVGFTSSHFFMPVKTLRVFPYRAQKTSVTAGTLGEKIFFKLALEKRR